MLVRLTCVPPGATVNVQQPLHHEPSDAMDDGTRALLILQRSPYTAGASAEQEWACRVLFDAIAREVQLIVRPEASTNRRSRTSSIRSCSSSSDAMSARSVQRGGFRKVDEGGV